MDLISEIMDNFKKEIFWLVFFTCIFLIAPGFLTIFYFDRSLFVNLEVIKLILLSILFAAPFVLINTFFWGLIYAAGDVKMDFDGSYFLIILGVFLTNIIFYCVLFFSYLIGLSFKTAIFSLVGLESLIIVLGIVFHFFASKEK